jgi:hypothetical protein
MPNAASPMPAARSARDVRLDFFRGLAMFIIFVAHVPDNSWFDWIPARFGFSSAAEVFVFCSGLASALAFGRVFTKDGFLAGTTRILFRIWQVYWAHIALSLVMITVSVIGLKLTGTDYPARVGLVWFFSNAADGFLRLMSLTFMPNFLDVLPMYLVLLAMIPAVIALARLHTWLALGALFALWLMVQITGVNLPGGPTPGGIWYFNPFAWQLVFFTGFAFGMGWLKAPALQRGALFWLCVLVLVLSVPLNFWAFTANIPALGEAHEALLGPHGKTNLNVLLYLHFLSAAYVALVLVEPIKHRLIEAKPIIMVGQQALATFMTSIVLAWVGGMVLDAIGRGGFATALVNLAGFAGLIATAWIASRYKGGKNGGTGKAAAKAPQEVNSGAVPRLIAQPAE